MMKIKEDFKAFYFVVVILLTLFVISCAAPATSPSASASASPSTSPTPAGPKSGGTIRIGVSSAPIGVDPIIVGTDTGCKVVTGTYAEGLTTSVGRNISDLKYVGKLAKSWEVAPDGKTITFKLREGVKWHNVPPVNGRELVADDFVYCFNRIKDPKTRSPVAGNLRDMESWTAPDKYTLVMKFTSPMPGYLQNMVASILLVFAPEVIKQDGNLGKTFVGTGPFILKEYVPNVKAVFNKNPDYWDKGKPYLDRVEVLFVPDEGQRKAAFRAGELDVLYDTKGFVDAIKSSNPNSNTIEGVSTRGIGLFPSIGGNPKLWGDKKVRQALMYAIDYDGLIKAVINGGGLRTGFFAPWYGDWGGKPVDQLPKHDIAKAKQLLAEAGYPNGFKTTIMQDSGRMDAWGGPVEAVTAMLKEVGIDASIITSESTTFTTNTRAGKFELCCQQCPTGNPGAIDNVLIGIYRSDAPQLYSKYINPKLDELVNATMNAFPNDEVRKKLTKEILAILEEDIPAIPLYNQYNYFIGQPWVVWPDTVDSQQQFAVNNLRDVWIDKK